MGILEEIAAARRAGELLNGLTWTDKELEEVLAGLNYVIPWMVGASYSKRIIGPLRAEREMFRQIRTEREKP